MGLGLDEKSVYMQITISRSRHMFNYCRPIPYFC